MALITVRPKGAAADAPTMQVDSRWPERWPDDFDVVEPTPKPAPAAATASADTPTPAPAQAAERSRF